MRLGLTCELTPLYLRISRRTLLLLEFGAGDSGLLHSSSCTQLSFILAGIDESLGRVGQILAAALGSSAGLPERVFQQVLADLDGAAGRGRR